MDTVKGFIDFDDTIAMPEGDYEACYNTQAYTEFSHTPDKLTTYCKSKHGNFMLDQSFSCDSFQLTVISGSIEQIKQLVQTELEGFDWKIEWP
jgi:hypothetical protein